MPPEETQPTATTTTTENTATTSESSTQAHPPPAATTAPSSQPGKASEKVTMVPHSAMKRIKEEAREKGRKQALEELNAQARAAGFKDFESMKAAAQRRAGNNAKQATSKPAASSNPKDSAASTASTDGATSTADPAVLRRLKKLEEENARLAEDRRRSNKLRSQDAKQRKTLERKLVEVEVENELKLAAREAGVSVEYLDFALDRLRRTVAGKSAEELKSFNEATYFQELRERMPVLFGTTERPANTAPAPKDSAPSNAKPPPPGPAAKAQAAPKDAMKMSRAEFQKHLEEQNLAKPGGSFIS